MAVAFDAFGSGATGLGGATLTFTHICSGTNRILLVGVCAASGSSGATISFSSVTYNSVAMTALYNYARGSQVQNGYFYLINPPTGSHSVVVTTTGGVAGNMSVAGASLSYTGVSQISFPDASNKLDSTGATATVAVTTSANNAWLAGFDALVGSASTTTAGTNTTQRVQSSGGGNSCPVSAVDSNAAQTPAGSHSLQVSSGFAGETYGFMVASLAPVATVNANFLMFM